MQRIGDNHALEMPDDVAMDQKIGILLRVGMYTASAVILAGGILYLGKHGGDRLDYSTFRMLPQNLRSPLAICATAFHGDPEAIMQLGMMLLIATPVARVIFSLVAFASRRDLLYVVISAVVLAVLCYSLIYH